MKIDEQVLSSSLEIVGHPLILSLEFATPAKYESLGPKAQPETLARECELTRVNRQHLYCFAFPNVEFRFDPRLRGHSRGGDRRPQANGNSSLWSLTHLPANSSTNSGRAVPLVYISVCWRLYTAGTVPGRQWCRREARYPLPHPPGNGKCAEWALAASVF
jgi:hypothetical protein